MKSRRSPVGTEWRTLVGGKGREPRVSTLSRDYAREFTRSAESRARGETILSQRTTFDELVIVMGKDCIHIEDMGGGCYLVELGDEKRMVTLGRDGKIRVGEVYR